MSEQIQCERCGVMVNYRGAGAHRKSCYRLPLPHELKQEMDDGATAAELGRKYKCNADTIVKRIAGAVSDKGRSVYEFVDGRRCMYCGVLLEHPSVPDAGNACAWCKLEYKYKEPPPSMTWAIGARA